MAKAIPILLSTDVEPDGRQLDPARPLPWKGYERTLPVFRIWREELARATGNPVHFSWFFRADPQVEQVYGTAAWPLRHYPELGDEFRRHGDELGLHVHFYRWDPPRRRWVVDHGDPTWVEHCLRFSLAAFQEGSGQPCRSFRGGDAWTSQAAVRILEAAGVRFDLTLEPGMEGYRSLHRSEASTGELPDLRGIPQAPYLPRAENFKQPDAGRRQGMWMIPVSRGEISGWPAWALRQFRRWVNGIRIEKSWVTLYLFQQPFLFRRVVEQMLDMPERPYLSITSHSQAVIRPYFFRNMKKNVRYLLSHPRRKDFVFSTPREALRALGVISGEEDVTRHA